MAETPHFDLPFRFVGGRAVVVEQDTLRDVQNCVEAILRTEPGTRESNPGFGLADLTFSERPLNLSSIMTQVAVSEPRATMLLEEKPDEFDELVTRVSVRATFGPFATDESGG